MMRVVPIAVPATGTRMGLADWERLSYDHSDRNRIVVGPFLRRPRSTRFAPRSAQVAK